MNGRHERRRGPGGARQRASRPREACARGPAHLLSGEPLEETLPRLPTSARRAPRHPSELAPRRGHGGSSRSRSRCPAAASRPVRHLGEPDDVSGWRMPESTSRTVRPLDGEADREGARLVGAAAHHSDHIAALARFSSAFRLDAAGAGRRSATVPRASPSRETRRIDHARLFHPLEEAQEILPQNPLDHSRSGRGAELGGVWRQLRDSSRPRRVLDAVEVRAQADRFGPPTRGVLDVVDDLRPVVRGGRPLNSLEIASSRFFGSAPSSCLIFSIRQGFSRSAFMVRDDHRSTK